VPRIFSFSLPHLDEEMAVATLANYGLPVSIISFYLSWSAVVRLPTKRYSCARVTLATKEDCVCGCLSKTKMQLGSQTLVRKVGNGK
jgi:hypothetical protein